MILLLTSIFFLFGLIIGSFLNVVIYRYNTEKTFGGRSACMVCRHTLAWYELIPVFSFFGLRGRCLSCKTKISMQYPAVELTTGIIFASLFYKFQSLFFVDAVSFYATFGYFAVCFSLLLVIAVYDLKHKIIPDTLVLAFGVIAFIGMFFFGAYGWNPHMPQLIEFFSGLILALPFALMWLLSKGAWMGLGDPKLIIGLGYLLGFSHALSGIVVAFWAGAIIGVALILLARKGMKSEIPFAPFLVLGAFIAFIFGLNIFPIVF